MRQEVADGRARRPRRLVQIDDAFLGGNENRERRDGLGDGCQSHRMRCISARRHFAAWIDDAGGGEWDRPVVDLAKCLHARRY